MSQEPSVGFESGRWQGYRDRRAGADRTSYLQVPAMVFGNPSGDCQTQAAATPRGSAAARKLLNHKGQLVLWNTGP